MAHKMSKKRDLIGKRTRKLIDLEGGAAAILTAVGTSYSLYKIYSCLRSLYQNYLYERELKRKIISETTEANVYWKTNSLCCKYFNSYKPYYYDLTKVDNRNFYEKLYEGINMDFYPTRYFDTSDNKITPLKFPDTLYFEVKKTFNGSDIDELSAVVSAGGTRS